MSAMRSRICLAAALACAAAVPAGAAGFSLEQIMAPPIPGQLVAAQQGERIAWVFNDRGERNVWVADGPSFTPRQVTHYKGDDGQPIASLRLSPDGWTVIYARGTEVNDGGESANPNHSGNIPKQQVWALDVDSGAAGKSEPRLLGDMGCGFEDCEDLQISPDGKNVIWAAHAKIWLAPLVGGTPVRPIVEPQGDNAGARWAPDSRHLAFRNQRKGHSFIVVTEIDGGEVRYLAPSTQRDDFPRWSADGKQLAFIRTPAQQMREPLIPEPPQPWSIWVADAQTGVGHEIWQSSQEAAGSLPLFGESSFKFAAQRIIFASEDNAGQRTHLYAISPEGGAATLLTDGDYDIEDVTLSTDRRSVIFSANEHAADPADEDRRHLWRVPITGGAAQALSRGATIEWSPVETGDGKTVVCIGSTATTPAMPYRLNGMQRQLITPTALGAEFPSQELVVPRQVIFKSEDGLTIHGQLFVPRAAAAEHSQPAVIFTHGGPVRQMLLGFHYFDYYHRAYAMNQYLASRGYVVLSVNYRLGIMYGRAFRQPAHAVWRGASEYRDVVAGAKFLATLPQVDTHRVGLWGGSYGGFLTAMGLARNSDLFAAGVDLHGVHDWSAFLPEWSGVSALTPPDAKEANELAFSSSPNSSIATWKSPVLLIQGDDDRNVPFEQTIDLYERLRARHVEVEEMVFPDEIHDFLRHGNWLQAYHAAADFFDRHLRPAAH
jgi:dipeptidyl aminopeptidase/acylaminoacyl peptidase